MLYDPRPDDGPVPAPYLRRLPALPSRLRLLARRTHLEAEEAAELEAGLEQLRRQIRWARELHEGRRAPLLQDAGSPALSPEFDVAILLDRHRRLAFTGCFGGALVGVEARVGLAPWRPWSGDGPWRGPGVSRETVPVGPLRVRLTGGTSATRVSVWIE